MSQYPGDDPNDPFAKPPQQPAGDETAPISGTPTPAPEEPGYWEKQAREQADQSGQQPQTSNPWAGYGEPAGSTPPPPPPTSAYPTPPVGQPYGQPAYAQPGYIAPPNHPSATTALVLGIISIACCGIAGPFAWVIGGRARREIRESNGQLGGDGQATAGWIMGIIATALIAIAVLFFVVILVIGLTTAGTSSTFDA